MTYPLNRPSAATIEAKIDADLAEKTLRDYEGRDYGWRRDDAEQYLKKMRSAVATIQRCADRMQTCKPSSRFTYAAHITKAKMKLTWAENDLRRLV